MEYRRAYGADALFDLPLIDAGAQTYLAAIPTIAAGDVKVFTDALISTNPTAFILGFDSMDAEPQPGDVIHEADAGDGQATVMFVVICSGTVGAGTAAGFMFVTSVSGTWTDDAVIDIDSPTVNLDCATVDAGTTGVYTLAANQIANTAGLLAFFGKRAYVALTAAEMSCKQGFVEVIDQTATEEWEDTSLVFVTEGHESALDPQGCILTDAVGSATGQTTSNIRLSGAPATAPKTGYYFEVVSGTAVGNAGYVKTYTAGATYDVVPYVALDIALGADSVVKFFRDAKRVPAHLVASEASSIPVGASSELASILADTGTDGVVVAAGSKTGYSLTNPAGVQKNVALSGFVFFMADSADHVSPKTGLTVTAQRSIDGAAFGACANSVSEISAGFYTIDLADTDLNGDVVALKFTATGADQRSIIIVTEP